MNLFYVFPNYYFGVTIQIVDIIFTTSKIIYTGFYLPSAFYFLDVFLFIDLLIRSDQEGAYKQWRE